MIALRLRTLGSCISGFSVPGAPRQWFALALVAALELACAPLSLAQVSITVGVQEIYDDNIFLENDRRRPAPVVLNDAIEEDLADGELSVFSSEELDGDPDDDFITNAFIALSSDVPQVDRYGDLGLEARVGTLTFADADNQDRLTVDALADFSTSENIIPRPFYLTMRGALTSSSNEAAVAEGTASRASETLNASLGTGISRWELGRRMLYSLGYTGGYTAYLGEFLFDRAENDPFEQEGSDFHSHYASTQLDYLLTQNWTVGVAGKIGVQLFTDVDSTNALDSGVKGLRPEDLDRTNSEVNAVTSYAITDRLTARASAGVGFSSFHDERRPVDRVSIDEDGMPVTTTFQPDKSDSSFIFSGDLNYIYRPGSVATVGIGQSFVTDQDGERLLTRQVFANVTHAIGDRWRINGGGTFIQFDEEGELSSSTDQLDLSASLSYSLTQYAALVVGYNFATQDADEDDDDALRFTSRDYDVNRAFVSLNVGFVGLPL